MDYSKQEIKLLKKFFPTMEKEYILSKLPNRSWECLRQTAYALGLERSKFSRSIPRNRFHVLLSNLPESLYWIGYLLADGTISKRSQLTVVSALEDRIHLQKFATFVGTRLKIEKAPTSGYCTNKGCCRVALADKKNSMKLLSKFDFKPRKTFRPPKISLYNKFSNKQILSILIGFIDGDGCIYRCKNYKCITIKIKNHRSWLPFLKMLNHRLERIVKIKNPQPKITRAGYALWDFSNRKNIELLDHVVKEFNLPVLSRKWEVICKTYNGKNIS